MVDFLSFYLRETTKVHTTHQASFVRGLLQKEKTCLPKERILSFKSTTLLTRKEKNILTDTCISLACVPIPLEQ